jgi:hypothetical protein
MSQYKPHVIEEDTRSAWERRKTGIHGHFAEMEEKHEREEETAPNPTVAPEKRKR